MNCDGGLIIENLFACFAYPLRSPREINTRADYAESKTMTKTKIELFCGDLRDPPLGQVREKNRCSQITRIGAERNF